MISPGRSNHGMFLAASSLLIAATVVSLLLNVVQLIVAVRSRNERQALVVQLEKTRQRLAVCERGYDDIQETARQIVSRL